MEEIEKFVAWVRKNFKHQKLGYRHKGDFKNELSPVSLESLLETYKKNNL